MCIALTHTYLIFFFFLQKEFSEMFFLQQWNKQIDIIYFEITDVATHLKNISLR